MAVLGGGGTVQFGFPSRILSSLPEPLMQTSSEAKARTEEKGGEAPVLLPDWLYAVVRLETTSSAPTFVATDPGASLPPAESVT